MRILPARWELARLLFENGNFSEGRDHIFVTPHHSESHPISLNGKGTTAELTGLGWWYKGSRSARMGAGIVGLAEGVRTGQRNKYTRSVRSSHLSSSSEIARPSSAMSRVSARSFIGSPRCDSTFTRKVTLPARTRCGSRQFKHCSNYLSQDVSVEGCPSGSHLLLR